MQDGTQTGTELPIDRFHQLIGRSRAQPSELTSFR